MKIEKLISIRTYDGKKTVLKSLKKMIKALEQIAPWQARIVWNEQEILQSITIGTCLMLMLGEEVCGLVNFHVQPLPHATWSIPILHQKESLWLSNFVIAPNFRRCGLGKMLLTVAQNYARYLNKRTSEY